MAFRRLMRILLFVTIMVSVWLAFVTESVPITLSPAAQEIIMISPVYLLIAFGCYSLATVGYRVANFNDCTEASDELQEQISEAKKDLKKKGFKFS